jgi:hypothetical protein
MLKENIRDNRDIELRQKEQRAATEQENIKEAGREQGRMISGAVEGYQRGRDSAVARKLSEEQIRGKQFENRMNEGYGEQEREAGLDLTRSNATIARAGAKVADRKENANVEGIEANTKVAQVEAKYAEPKAQQAIVYQDTLTDQTKATAALATLSAEEKQEEMDYQRSDASAIGLPGAKKGESVKAWMMRTDSELKATDAQHRTAELAIKAQALKEAVANAPLQRSLLKSQIAGNYVSNAGQALANKTAQLNLTGQEKQARLTDISMMLRSNNPQTAAKLKGYAPEEVAEAFHKNKMTDQQSAFLANEIRKQDPEYAFALEQKMEALREANNYKNIIGDLKVMQTSYKTAAGTTFDGKVALNDRNRIASYFEQAGHPDLAEKVRKGWEAKDPMSVNTTIEQGIKRIREEANKRLMDHAGMPGVASALNGMGLSPYPKGDGSTGLQDTGTINPFFTPAIPPPNSSAQPPAGMPLPQFIQGQPGQGGYQQGLGAPPAQPRKTMRPAASVRK